MTNQDLGKASKTYLMPITSFCFERWCIQPEHYENGIKGQWKVNVLMKFSAGHDGAHCIDYGNFSVLIFKWMSCRKLWPFCNETDLDNEG